MSTKPIHKDWCNSNEGGLCNCRPITPDELRKKSERLNGFDFTTAFDEYRTLYESHQQLERKLQSKDNEISIYIEESGKLHQQQLAAKEQELKNYKFMLQCSDDDMHERLEQIRAKDELIQRYQEIFKWLNGEGDDFPIVQSRINGGKGLYAWRTEMNQKIADASKEVK